MAKTKEELARRAVQAVQASTEIDTDCSCPSYTCEHWKAAATRIILETCLQEPASEQGTKMTNQNRARQAADYQRGVLDLIARIEQSEPPDYEYAVQENGWNDAMTHCVELGLDLKDKSSPLPQEQQAVHEYQKFSGYADGVEWCAVCWDGGCGEVKHADDPIHRAQEQQAVCVECGGLGGPPSRYGAPLARLSDGRLSGRTVGGKKDCQSCGGTGFSKPPLRAELGQIYARELRGTQESGEGGKDTVAPTVVTGKDSQLKAGPCPHLHQTYPGTAINECLDCGERPAAEFATIWHWSKEIGRAACGADKPNQGLTDVAPHLTCLQCCVAYICSGTKSRVDSRKRAEFLAGYEQCREDAVGVAREVEIEKQRQQFGLDEVISGDSIKFEQVEGALYGAREVETRLRALLPTEREEAEQDLS